MSPSKKLFLVRALPVVLVLTALLSIAPTTITYAQDFGRPGGAASDVDTTSSAAASGPQQLKNQLKFPDKLGYPRSGPIENVVDLISVLVWAFPSVMGAAALLMVIVAGFLMVSAMGNEEKIERAKMHLFYIAVGLGLLGFAYMIISFVIRGITTPLTKT